MFTIFIYSDHDSFYGLTGKQVNIYIRKIGFTDIIDQFNEAVLNIFTSGRVYFHNLFTKYGRITIS